MYYKDFFNKANYLDSFLPESKARFMAAFHDYENGQYQACAAFQKFSSEDYCAVNTSLFSLDGIASILNGHTKQGQELRRIFVQERQIPLSEFQRAMDSLAIVQSRVRFGLADPNSLPPKKEFMDGLKSSQKIRELARATGSYYSIKSSPLADFHHR